MSNLPRASDLLAVARRVVWFKEPEETLKDPVFFLCHLMTYTLPEDVDTVLKYATPDDLRHALEHAPPGIFDARSWHYWNLKLGRNPVPSMPERKLAASETT